jgi:hypothetical protein
VPGVPRRTDRPSPVEGAEAPRALLPGGRRGAARGGGDALRPRRRAGDPGARAPLVRRPAPAHPPRREPRGVAGGVAPRDAGRLRPPRRGIRRPRRAAALRTTRAARGVRSPCARPRPARRPLARDRLSADGAPLAGGAGERARRRGREASGRAVPLRGARRDGEGEAAAHRGLRRRRLPPLGGRPVARRFAPPRALRPRRPPPPRRLRLVAPGRRTGRPRAPRPRAPRRHGVHRAGAGRPEPLERAERDVGARAPVLVVEVEYDHVSGGRFRHGTRFLRRRPDKDPRSCTMDQIATRGRGPALPKSPAARKPRRRRSA